MSDRYSVLWIKLMRVSPNQPPGPVAVKITGAFSVPLALLPDGREWKKRTQLACQVPTRQVPIQNAVLSDFNPSNVFEIDSSWNSPRIDRHGDIDEFETSAMTKICRENSVAHFSFLSKLLALVLAIFVMGSEALKAAECRTAEYDYDFTVLLVPEAGQAFSGQAFSKDVNSLLKPVSGGNPGHAGPAIPRLGVAGKPMGSSELTAHYIWPEWTDQMISQKCSLIRKMFGNTLAAADIANNLSARLDNMEVKAPPSFVFENALLNRQAELASFVSAQQAQGDDTTTLVLFLDNTNTQTTETLHIGSKDYAVLSDFEKVSARIKDFLTNYKNIDFKPTIILVLAKTSPAIVAQAQPTSAMPSQSAVPSNVLLTFSGSNTLGSKLMPQLAKGFIEKLYATRQPRVQIIDGAKDGQGEIVYREVRGELDGGTTVSIIVQAHGSATAFKEDAAHGIVGVGLFDKKVDIGMSSRKIKPAEVDLLQALGKVDAFGPGQGRGGEHVIAMDGIAIIVNRSNPMTADISLQDLKKIYAGEITKWEQLPGANGMKGDIQPVRRDYLSGTYDFFSEKVMGMKPKKGPTDPTPEPLSAAKAAFEDSNALSSFVADNHQAIGFVGVSYIGAAKALAVKATSRQAPEEAVLPDTQSVRSGKYPLSRPLYLYTQNPPREEIRQFIQFALSEDGQRIVAQEAQSINIIGSQYELPTARQPSVTSTLINLETGKPIRQALAAEPKAEEFEIEGSLPPGLTLDTKSGAISGTAGSEGNFTLQARARNSEGWGKWFPVQIFIRTAKFDTVLRMQGSNTIGSRLAVELAEQFMREKNVAAPEVSYGPEIETREGKARDVYVVGDINHNGRNVAIEIKSHGSTTAFTCLREGLCDIGFASRQIKPAEYSEVSPTSLRSLQYVIGDINNKPENTPISGEIILGYDGVAIIVNDANGLNDLDIKTVRKIYAGEITRWEEIEGSNLQGAISVYAKGAQSGTFEFFKERAFPEDKLVATTHNQYEDGQQMVRDISQDRMAIGFVALPDARNVKVLKIREGNDAQPLEPNTSSIHSRSYALHRPLYLYLSQSASAGGQVTPASLRLANEFAQMVLSVNGQIIVKNNGFVPVRICPNEGDDCPGKSGRWKIPEHITFDAGKDRIDSKTRQNINTNLKDFFESHPEYRSWQFYLVGYTDHVGSTSANLELSRRRALEAKLYLEGLEYNVRAYEGRGATDFIGDEETDNGRAKSRRVEMILEPPQ